MDQYKEEIVYTVGNENYSVKRVFSGAHRLEDIMKRIVAKDVKELNCRKRDFTSDRKYGIMDHK